MSNTNKKRISVIAGIVALTIAVGTYAYYHHLDTSLKKAQPTKISLKKADCPNDTFKILSIDGGGTRGVIPLRFIQHIEEITQQPISQSFDLVAGISTGSIVATALTIPNKHGQPKYSAKNIADMYLNNAQTIFSTSLLHDILTVYGVIAPRYLTKHRNQLFLEQYNNSLMSKLLTYTAVYGYDSQAHNIIEFCNADVCSAPGKQYLIRDILEGTTAIFSLFPSKLFEDELGNTQHTVNDLSIIHNNPDYFAYKLGKKICPNAKKYLVISLGTGSYPAKENRPKEMRSWGLAKWLPHIAKIIADNNSDINAHMMASIDHHSDNDPQPLTYIRIEPPLSWKSANPLDTQKAHLLQLIDIAKQHQKQNTEQFEQIKSLLLKNNSPTS